MGECHAAHAHLCLDFINGRDRREREIWGGRGGEIEGWREGRERESERDSERARKKERNRRERERMSVSTYAPWNTLIIRISLMGQLGICLKIKHLISLNLSVGDNRRWGRTIKGGYWQFILITTAINTVFGGPRKIVDGIKTSGKCNYSYGT